jgi:hypothetical protein
LATAFHVYVGVVAATTPLGDTSVAAAGTVVENVADTVQLPVMAAVVYVVPDKEPPHVPPTEAVYPVFGGMLFILRSRLSRY